MTPALEDLRDQGDEVDVDWIRESHPGILPISDETVRELRAYVIERWEERARERGEPRPSDLSSSCKFGSLFCKALLGGEIRGNFDHVHVFVEGRIVDLSEGAQDVAALAAPYRNDPDFLSDEDFAESLESCLPRVSAWVSAFLHERTPKP